MRKPVPPELDEPHSKMQMNKSLQEPEGRNCLNEVMCPQTLPDIPEAWLFGEAGFFSSVVGAWGSGISSLELGCPVPPRLCPGTPMVPAGFSSGLWVCSLSLSSYTTVGPCCAHVEFLGGLDVRLPVVINLYFL